MSFANIAALTIHDVKNKLASIAGVAESRGDQDTVQAIIEVADTLTRLLVFYRAEHDTLYLNINSHTPEDLISELTTNHYGRADISIASNTNEAPLMWMYDELLIRMILENALQNASRFAKNRILISAREIEAYLEITVQDDGPGFTLNQLVDNDYHARVTQEGTGLGLVLARHIAALHTNNQSQGRIELSNQNGAVFRLLLPA